MRLPDHRGTHQLPYDGSAVPPGALPGVRGQGEVRGAGRGAPDSRQGVCTCWRAGEGGDADIPSRDGTIGTCARACGRPRRRERPRVRLPGLGAARHREPAMTLLRLVLRGAVVVAAAFLALFVRLCCMALRLAIGLR